MAEMESDKSAHAVTKKAVLGQAWRIGYGAEQVFGHFRDGPAKSFAASAFAPRWSKRHDFHAPPKRALPTAKCRASCSCMGDAKEARNGALQIWVPLIVN